MKKFLFLICSFLISFYYVNADTLFVFSMKENNYSDLKVNDITCIDIMSDARNDIDEANIHINYSNEYFDFVPYDNNNDVYLNNGWKLNEIKYEKNDYEFDDPNNYGYVRFNLTGGPQQLINESKNYNLITKVCFKAKATTGESSAYISLNDKKTTVRYDDEIYANIVDSILYYDIKDSITNHLVDSSLSSLNILEYKATLSKAEIFNVKKDLYKYFPNYYKYEINYIEDLDIEPFCSSINCEIKYYKNEAEIEGINSIEYDNTDITIVSTVDGVSSTYKLYFNKKSSTPIKNEESVNDTSTEVVEEENGFDFKLILLIALPVIAIVVIVVLIISNKKKNKWKKRFDI